MSTSILATKLYIPPPRPNVVFRPRLIERLNEGLHFGRKLTLISAPAGFGKTTLIADWGLRTLAPARSAGVAESTIPHSAISNPQLCWLSLDTGDNDRTRFLAYLVAALQTIAPTIGEGVLAALHSPQPPPTESILTTLLNNIATASDYFVLVLDDYHVIEAKAVDEALTFLLEHLSPQLHLVITTREDPNLPLARLRVRGQLTELRAADLRFTPGEAAAFLNQVMGLDLSAEDVTSLETRTEGWIAGLQLAALSMQGRADVAGFIRAFAGDNRYIVDYLVEEVLQRQPERVRRFLLQTSLLDRLSGSLCDAVLGRGAAEPGSRGEFPPASLPLGSPVSGQKTLEYLEQANLFIVPLDDKRHWFRYHHLFADVLRVRLLEEQPDRVPTLHQRASVWYEQNGLPAEAIRHALAAEDFERAAGLAELEWPAMDGRFQAATWLGWVQALPDELVRVRPVLSAAYGWAFLNDGELEAGEARLRDAERWLDLTAAMSEPPEAPSGGMVVVDEEQFQSLPASIATARAYIAQALGDMSGTVKYARQALDFLPKEDHLGRGPAAALLGIAQWARGDLEAAHQALAEALTGFRMAGNMHFAISGTYGLADIRLAQGRLREAVRTYEQSLQLVAAQSETVRGTADLYLGLGDLHREQGDLEAARQYLLRSEELGEQAGLPDWPYRSRVVQAHVKETQGDLDGALDLLDEADRLYHRTPMPEVRPIAALKARVWVRQGRLAKALAWARERGLFVDDDLSYLREFEHIILARVLIAEYKSERADRSILEAVGLLERLLQAAEEGGRIGSAIEILVQQALAYEAQGDIPSALVPLERALALAEQEGYVRLFVDEGPPLAKLLTRMNAEGGRRKDYIHKLLAAFDQKEKPQPFGSVEPQTPYRHDHPSSLSPQPLVEPLSEREIEVLHLIAEGLTNQDIATRLYLSLHTVKVHARNIYGKLGVKNRTQAVARGKALGILSRT